jgi:quinol monooxygenase YgiN
VIIGTIRIVPLPHRRAEILDVLQTVQGPVLAQAGCLACQICEEQGPEQAVVFIERWETRAALSAHLQSETYRRILAAIELSGSPPEIRFDHVSSSEGMELIRRSRAPEREPALGTKGDRS